ncbi:MAG: phosphatase PAP2 family protein [Ferruginibacter sp.]
MRRQTILLTKKIIATVKVLSVELLVLLVAFIASFVTVLFFIKLIFLDKKDHFDLHVFDLISPFVSHNMTIVMNFFTFFGGQYFLIPANLALIVYTFFIAKDRWFSIKIVSVALSSLLLMFFLKFVFKRPRPLIPLLEQVGGLSFPSGHAFMSFAFFGLLIYMAYKKIKDPWLRYFFMLFFFLMTTFVGFSRVYLRVHYASDVLVGFSLSLIWLVISLAILAKIEQKGRAQPINEEIQA